MIGRGQSRATLLSLLLALAFVFAGGERLGPWSAIAAAASPHAVNRPAVDGGQGLQAAPQRFAVGEIVVHYVDHSRWVRYPGEPPIPRPLVTVIRYPAVGSPSRLDVRSAAPARAQGPYPLIVFGHGYDITPAPYKRLMEAWARAGYVVAAPIFPRSNADAPGGPDEADLINQPTDMSFVITRLLTASARKRGILAGLVARHRIAVSGQSDGGSTALAAAYNSYYVDHRIGAAVILSGAEIPGLGGYDFPAPSPPLLAVQGTADTSNAPSSTYRYYGLAPPPKFLLQLIGAQHLPPYTSEQPQLGIVERVSLAFLDRYLKRMGGARSRMWKSGEVPGVARLTAS